MYASTAHKQEQSCTLNNMHCLQLIQQVGFELWGVSNNAERIQGPFLEILS